MPQINQLNTLDTPNDSDLLPIYSQQNGDARKVSVGNLRKAIESGNAQTEGFLTQYSFPTGSGFTTLVVSSKANIWLILRPTAPFNAGTIKLPPQSDLFDGQRVIVNTTEEILNLTIDGNGANLSGQPITLEKDGSFELRYDAGSNIWYRVSGTSEDAQAVWYVPAGAGAVATTVQAKLREFVSVKDFGAVGDGSDATAAFSAAAKGAPAAVNIVGAEGGLPRAPMCRVTVPAGSYVLSSEIDTGNREVIWEIDPAAVITGYAYLNGEVFRAGQRQADYHHGTTDYACTYSIRANADLDDGAEILGITSASQLATYADRDSVTLYVDNIAPAASVDVSTATYTSTTVTITAPSSTTLRQYRRGMIIDTNHSPKWSGIVDSWNTDGSVLTVTGWYQVGGGGTPGTPANGIGCVINGFTKVWAHNSNVFLNSSSYATKASGFELGVFNNKGALDFAAEKNYIWGYDAVSLGANDGAVGFIARNSSSRFFRGFESRGAVQYAFHVADTPSKNPSAGFASSQTTGFSFYHINAGAVRFSVNNEGTLYTAGPRVTFENSAVNVQFGNPAIGGTLALDFNSSSNGVDYDTRIRATGGSATNGQGVLDIFTGTYRVQANDLIEHYALTRPSVDNGLDMGQLSNRWRRIYGNEIRPGAGAAVWTSGAGTPEGVVTASVGSLYTRTDGGAGTTLYVKEAGTGNTGWAAK